MKMTTKAVASPISSSRPTLQTVGHFADAPLRAAQEAAKQQATSQIAQHHRQFRVRHARRIAKAAHIPDGMLTMLEADDVEWVA